MTTTVVFETPYQIYNTSVKDIQDEFSNEVRFGSDGIVRRMEQGYKIKFELPVDSLPASDKAKMARAVQARLPGAVHVTNNSP